MNDSSDSPYYYDTPVNSGGDQPFSAPSPGFVVTPSQLAPYSPLEQSMILAGNGAENVSQGAGLLSQTPLTIDQQQRIMQQSGGSSDSRNSLQKFLDGTGAGIADLAGKIPSPNLPSLQPVLWVAGAILVVLLLKK